MIGLTSRKHAELWLFNSEFQYKEVGGGGGGGEVHQLTGQSY